MKLEQMEVYVYGQRQNNEQMEVYVYRQRQNNEHVYHPPDSIDGR